MLSACSLFATVQGRVPVMAEESLWVMISFSGMHLVDSARRQCFFVLRLRSACHFCYGCVIPTWHGTLVPFGTLELSSRLFIEQAHQCFIRGVVFQMVDPVSSCKQIRNSCRGWLVGDCATDDVGHVPVVLFRGNSQLRCRIETT